MNDNDWIDIKKDTHHVNRERKKAKELRKSNWWKKQISIGKCYYCNKKVPPNEITMDHVVPVIRGGKSIKAIALFAVKAAIIRKNILHLQKLF